MAAETDLTRPESFGMPTPTGVNSYLEEITMVGLDLAAKSMMGESASTASCRPLVSAEMAWRVSWNSLIASFGLPSFVQSALACGTFAVSW